MATSHTSEQTTGSAKGRPKGVMLPGLAAAMRESNRNRAELARKVGVSRPYLWKLEQERHGTTSAVLQSIAAELGVDVGKLTHNPS